MAAGGDSRDLEARFELALERDRRLLAFFNSATLAGSLLTVAILMTLVIPMGRTSIWLISLSVYATATRLLVFVARYALGVPLFLLELDSPDAASATAARAVFERNREPVVRTLLTAGNSHPTPEQIRELTPEAAAALARERDLPGRRRTGVICLVLWTAATIAIWTMVVATGGGPTT